MRPLNSARGYSLIEVVFVLGLGVTLSAVAVPQYLAGIDDFRASGAARYVSARFQRARMEAVMRSTPVALQFVQTPDGYRYAVYLDGNGNGVLTSDIASGVDRQINAAEQLRDRFAGVDFGAVPGLPPIDPGGTAPGNDPIRLGAGSLATFTPLGSSSSGTVYIKGRHNAQYAVRIFGDTGKTRMLKFVHATGRWSPL
jgi:type II secretory pathway pseudopilin PulG